MTLPRLESALKAASDAPWEYDGVQYVISVPLADAVCEGRPFDEADARLIALAPSLAECVIACERELEGMSCLCHLDLSLTPMPCNRCSALARVRQIEEGL